MSGCTGSKVTVLGYTQHTGGTTDWVEHRDNKLIGVEFPVSDNGSIEFTDFTNSFGDPSQVVNYNYRWRAGDDSQFLGIKFLMGRGYNEDPGFWEPFILPVITKDLEHVSFDLHAVPGVVWILFVKIPF